MTRSMAALGSAAFFLAAPGTVVGLVPWLITGWHAHHPAPWWIVAQVVGVALVCAGLVPIVHAFIQFTRAGGTPNPLSPTPRLVVTGFNRYVRNPMYLGVLVALIGEALLFGSPGVLAWAVAVFAATWSFVRWYEEPSLARRFGARYREYRRAVPGWWPRARPWTG